MEQNERAFLDMIAFSEGTSSIPDSDNGYRVIVGGSTFEGFADHPRKSIFLPRLNVHSTAAGRYQLLSRYYDAYRKLLGLKDFSPASQDAIALQQIKECRAIEDVRAGRFDKAIVRVKHIWASLPGAGYGQHEQQLDKLRDVYVAAGGTVVEG